MRTEGNPGQAPFAFRSLTDSFLPAQFRSISKSPDVCQHLFFDFFDSPSTASLRIGVCRFVYGPLAWLSLCVAALPHRQRDADHTSRRSEVKGKNAKKISSPFFLPLPPLEFRPDLLCKLLIIMEIQRERFLGLRRNFFLFRVKISLFRRNPPFSPHFFLKKNCIPPGFPHLPTPRAPLFLFHKAPSGHSAPENSDSRPSR